MFGNEYDVNSFEKKISLLNDERKKTFLKFQKRQADSCNNRCFNIHKKTKLLDFKECFDICLRLTLNRAEIINSSLSQVDLLIVNQEKFKKNIEEREKNLSQEKEFEKNLNEPARNPFPDYMYSTNAEIGIQDAQKADDLKQMAKNKDRNRGKRF